MATEAQPAEAQVEQGEGPPSAAPLISLFGDTPKKAMEKMNEIADILRDELMKPRRADKSDETGMIDVLVFKSRGEERQTNHCSVEGWVFAGGLVGVTTRTRWTRPWKGEVDIGEWRTVNGQRRKVTVRKETEGWESYEEVVTLSGTVIGGHEGMCLRAERRWGEADEYAIRSMAQTRARSQALAGILRHLVEMAGFSGTPSEEMTAVVENANEDEAERNAPKRTVYGGWKSLWAAFAAIPAPGAEAFFGRAVTKVYGIEMSKYTDLGDHAADDFKTMHDVLYALRDAGFGEGVIPEPSSADLAAAFKTGWPALAERLEADTGGAPAETEPVAPVELPSVPETDDTPDFPEPGEGYGT